MSEQTTVIIIGVSVVINFILIVAVASLWIFMGEEGKFFFKRKFDNKGIDVLRHEPLSNRMRLITVKWDGQFFRYNNELLFFGIDKILNPNTESKKYFNEVVGRMCTWAGSKRPVLFATDVMCHLISPDLLSLAAKTMKHEQYTEAKTLHKKFPGKPELEKVAFLETIKPDDLTAFMEDISARDAMMSYDTGKRVNELERAKTGINLGSTGKIVISLAFIGIVVLVIWMVATGKMDTIINTLK